MAEPKSAPSADPLELFVKPWVQMAETYWGAVLGAAAANPEAVAFAGDRQREIWRLRRNLSETMDRQLALLDLPSRGDIDALACDIADLRAMLTRIEDRLEVIEAVGERR